MNLLGDNVPQIGFGSVRHTRLRPQQNAFSYPTYFLMLPMRSMSRMNAGALDASALRRNQFSSISFYDCDHGDGRADALQWLDELLRSEGISDAQGEVWLHCYPRVFGYTFKPVSFWYCHRVDGNLRSIVVEVNNTFGERHVYLLDAASYGKPMSASKVFHVSPFCQVQGEYAFRFLTSADRNRTVARIDYSDAGGALLQTSVSGALQPLDSSSIRKALLRYGWMSLLIVVRIHWQALILWVKRVPYFSKPAAPEQFVSR